MNVAAHQEKEKNEKTGKRKKGEERKQADFKEAACYPSTVCVCVCVCVYPSSSLGWRYGMNGNSGSCRQPN